MTADLGLEVARLCETLLHLPLRRLPAVPAFDRILLVVSANA